MIDPNADRAVFRQLADLLRDRILSGKLAPGEKLPSELRLTQEHGLSRTTVRQAMAILRSEGLVVVDRPRGTKVRTTEPTETVTLRKGDTASTRMPSPAERRDLDLAEGVPVVVITRADGSTELYPGDRTRVGR
ncbi:GntR family transcriptional regulator [Plantactinospora soyae]|uniref:GntR family transcriptional regulator n=1 Tax=Plantactinospora soyae TaxID=1544732 RepID=A0A927MBU8_9ACTN|nr:winged helix-turn-helix domain-containing protein [Plantactinospora soyae]MBE1491707.1 GntR family transcriptional regulator [Plantactinospora soyae]